MILCNSETPTTMTSTLHQAAKRNWAASNVQPELTFHCQSANEIREVRKNEVSALLRKRFAYTVSTASPLPCEVVESSITPVQGPRSYRESKWSAFLHLETACHLFQHQQDPKGSLSTPTIAKTGGGMVGHGQCSQSLSRFPRLILDLTTSQTPLRKAA